MRPSRTQFVLVVIAVGGAALQLAPQALDVPVGLASVGYHVVTDLLLVAAALGYGYRVGKTGRAGSPRIVAREYLLAGLLGIASLFAIGVLAFDFSLGARWFDVVVVARSVVDFVVPFVLAGMAGVPLGAMAAGEDEGVREGTTAEGDADVTHGSDPGPADA